MKGVSTQMFPELELSNLLDGRDAMHGYSRLLGKIRGALTPKQKHWWNISLRTSAVGLITTPIAVFDRNKSVELELNCVHHKISIRSSKGEEHHIALEGQSLYQLYDNVTASLASIDVYPELDKSLFSNKESFKYDRKSIEALWQVLSQVDLIFKEFKGGLRQETSPVQLWPHHFDLAFLWFSGRLVPDQDPNNEEYADEQMNFGFSTGDDSIPEPYFYITAYPLPKSLPEVQLPSGAYWEAQVFNAAILKYKELIKSNDPKDTLINFLKAVHDVGSELMLMK